MQVAGNSYGNAAVFIYLKTKILIVSRYYLWMCSVWVGRKPPGFAFIEFEDRRDADDAIRALNGICAAF